eukprot:COSAG04_NODE_27096_length_286_cov_1.887701_1_plen_36_part_10
MARLGLTHDSAFSLAAMLTRLWSNRLAVELGASGLD